MRRLIILAGLCFAGCATVGQKSDMNRLQKAVESYTHAYRWKTTIRQSGCYSPTLESPYLAAYEEDESSLQIEDIRVVRVELRSAGSSEDYSSHSTGAFAFGHSSKKKLTQYWVKIGDQWLLEAEENSIRLIDPLSKSDLAKTSPAAQCSNRKY